jgi:hypothetical protein
MFIQYGGEESFYSELPELMEQWTRELQRDGGKLALFQQRLADIRPREGTSNKTFRDELDAMAMSLGLTMYPAILDKVVTNDWESIKNAVEDDVLRVTNATIATEKPDVPRSKSAVQKEVLRLPSAKITKEKPAVSSWGDVLYDAAQAYGHTSVLVPGEFTNYRPPLTNTQQAPRGPESAPAPAPAPPESAPAPAPAPEPSPGARAKTAAHDLKATGESLSGASSLEKIKLLEAIQLDPNLRAMVQAGMLNWADLMKTNDGSVVNSDGTKPELILDEAKLQDVQSKLLRLGLQQQAEADMQVQRYQRQRTTSGAKPGAGFFGNKSVYMGPRYTPGRLPNTKNVSLL